MNDGLPDIQNARAGPRENTGEGVRDSGAIVAGDIDQQDAGFGVEHES